ncbi:hypothetical protein [Okeania sp. SIO3I5]|nr:hypothetical protein [Okeania sp. SIO3I5]
MSEVSEVWDVYIFTITMQENQKLGLHFSNADLFIYNYHVR